MSDRSKIHQALSELKRTREGLTALEDAFLTALADEDRVQTNVLGELEAVKTENTQLREQNERLGTRVGASIQILKNARAVYVKLVTRDVLSDRSILHEIRGEIDQIDEKIRDLREKRA